MRVLHEPGTWMILIGGVIILIGIAMQCSTQRNTDHMEQWKKDVLAVRSYRSRYPTGIGAIILGSGVLLLTELPPLLVLLFVGLAYLVWGIIIQNGQRRRQDPIRGHAGYILIAFGIVILIFGGGLFLLF